MQNGDEVAEMMDCSQNSTLEGMAEEAQRR